MAAAGEMQITNMAAVVPAGAAVAAGPVTGRRFPA